MKVLELFSGIGGMHFAVKESGINAEVVAAVDINTVANIVYKHNFPETKLWQRNIQSFSVDELNKISPNVILMSPPCQPFTKVGLLRDVDDERTCALLYIISVLPKINIDFKYLLVENVKGFETSEARCKLIHCLNSINFAYQEFILSPTQLGIPNSRSRYYLIAKRIPLSFNFPLSSDVVMNELPSCFKLCILSTDSFCSLCPPLSDVIEFDSDADNNDLTIMDRVLFKYGKVMDVVTKESRKTCCFTKAYGHYVEGTGSVYSPLSEESVRSIRNQIEFNHGDFNENMKKLRLRYFSPSEISKLMNFPNGFDFPNELSRKQKYRLLGNSINVKVVSILIKLMLFNDTIT